MLLSLQQTAKLVNVSERTIQRWIATKKLPAAKQKRQWVIDLADILKIITLDDTQLATLERERGVSLIALLARVERIESALNLG